jgi:hypothetical protein
MAKKKSKIESIESTIDGVSEITRQAQSEQFHREVMEIQKSGCSLIEAITAYCEEREMDVEDIVTFMTPRLMADLTREAAGLKLLKKEYRDSLLD